MKKVITYGTFDMFHEGHYNILKRAREYGDYLIVGVTGESYDVGRGKLSVHDSLATRIENVKKSGFADEIIVEEYLGQKISDIIKYGVDVFVIGDDWKGKFDHLGEYCEMVYLERTKGISSTQIRQKTYDKYNIGIIADRCDDNMLISEASKVSGFQVTRMFANTAELAEALAEKYEVEITRDKTEFYEDIDIVFVETELENRYKYIKAALKAGKHVIADHPFCLDVEKEKELLRLSEENNVILMHNNKSFHTQVFIQLLWMVKSGIIGDIVRMECSASRTDKTRKGMLFDLTSSALFMILKLLGHEYLSMEKRVIFEGRKPEYISMTFNYPDAEAEINVGNKIRVDNKIEIIGTKGTIRLGDNWWRADSFEMIGINDIVPQKYIVNYDGNGFKFLIKDISIMLGDGRTDYRLLSKEEDVAVTKILQSIVNG